MYNVRHISADMAAAATIQPPFSQRLCLFVKYQHHRKCMPNIRKYISRRPSVCRTYSVCTHSSKIIFARDKSRRRYRLLSLTALAEKHKHS